MAAPKSIRFALSEPRRAVANRAIKNIKDVLGVPIVNPIADPPADTYDRIIDLCDNGSFIEGTIGWYVTTSGGTIGVSTDHSSYSISNASANQTTYARQDMALPAGDKVFIRARCWLDSGSLTGGIFMSIGIAGSMGTVVKTFVDASLGAEWRYTGAIVTVPAGSTGLRIIAGRSSAQTAAYHITDIQAIHLTGNIDPDILAGSDADLLTWCDTRYPKIDNVYTPDPPAVDPTWIDVTAHSVTGDGETDDTAAINAIITSTYQSGGGTVYFPAGTYMINAAGTSGNGGLRPKSGVHMRLHDDAILQAITTSSGAYQIIWFYNVSNSSLMGGQIKGERLTHTGTTGETGYGIRMTSCSNIVLSDFVVSECWGENIAIGGTLAGHQWSDNILIENFTSEKSRKQGISIFSVKGLTIRNGILQTTGLLSGKAGTNPKAGIDFEPEAYPRYVQNVIVEDCTIIDNDGWGIDWWFFHLADGNMTENVTIAINRCTVTGNGSGQIRYSGGFTPANAYYKYLDITIDGAQIGSGGV